MDIKHRILQESFGYQSFRAGQEKLIDAMLAGRDVLGVMPTGAGKSICYQLAGLLLPGVTLVISPLISLMQDQVTALWQKGIAACRFHSAQSVSERTTLLREAAMGRYKLIYIAPERLQTDAFTQLVQQLPISMVAVDEAHCISQWGHDFRPSYRQIPQFLQSLPHRPIISAFTATATPQVREDIAKALSLHEPVRLITSFDRPNLCYEVQRCFDREEQLVRFILAQNGASGIVYCLTRKKTEEMARYLYENGILAEAYHAGMEMHEREAVQRRFLSGKLAVIVATNAFGMGIDKADVRFVVHFGMPRDLESYYQEAGRAGRDGAPARCLLLFGESDLSLHEYLIDREPENPALTDEEVRWLQKRSQKRLKQMKRYVYTEKCLRQHILGYFGQDAPDFCGFCSSCEAASLEKDITIEAQKVLSCIYRAQEQCDGDTVNRILRGYADVDLQQAGYDTLSTFGIMPDVCAKEITTVIERLLSLGYLVRQDDPHPRLRLCARAKNVLFQGEKVTLRVRASARKVRLERALQGSVHPKLSRALREHRKKLARRKGVPESMIFSDRALELLVKHQPQTEKELRYVLKNEPSQQIQAAFTTLSVIQKFCCSDSKEKG